jgi:hypothetical protein
LRFGRRDNGTCQNDGAGHAQKKFTHEHPACCAAPSL